MTSISQPINLPQASNNASPAAAPSHSPSASTGGKPTAQAAGPASAKSSYANATKRTFSPPSASSGSTPGVPAHGQHGKLDTSPPVNGRIAIPPAVPAVGSPTIVNGNTPTSSTSGIGDHSRKPSVTISAAGASGYLPNGAAVAGKSSGRSDIQFGALGGAGSSAALNASPQPTQSSDSLTVNAPTNPRMHSPQTSPSPIPQPPASGGKPPSSLHGHSNSVSFGNFGGVEGNVSARISMPSELRR